MVEVHLKWLLQVSLELCWARALVTCPVVVLVWPQTTLLAYSLRHETKSNSLGCASPRSGQLVRFSYPLTTLPVTFKVIFISVVAKRRYSISAFIRSRCLLAFSLLITVEPSECFLTASQFVSFLSGIFQRKLGCGVTPQCDMELPKMLPMCFFMPPDLASCLPKFRAYYNVFLGGPLDISITKQPSNLESVVHVDL